MVWCYFSIDAHHSFCYSKKALKRFPACRQAGFLSFLHFKFVSYATSFSGPGCIGSSPYTRYSSPKSRFRSRGGFRRRFRWLLYQARARKVSSLRYYRSGHRFLCFGNGKRLLLCRSLKSASQRFILKLSLFLSSPACHDY